MNCEVVEKFRQEQFFRVHHLGSVFKVDVEEVAYIKSEHKYANIVTDKGQSYLIEASLSDLITRLEGFVRIHRNCIVRKQYAKEMKCNGTSVADGVKLYMFPPGTWLDVSRRCYSELRVTFIDGALNSK